MRQKNNFSEWVVFENDDYIVINKPPYVSTLEDRTGAESVLDLAKKYLQGAQVCHRLDKETSGALLLSKNTDAYKFANEQFATRKIEKIYHAVADGIHYFDDEKIDLPLHISGSGAVRINRKVGKPSTTFATSLKMYKYHTLVECKPVTGRLHQIRVHMAAIGAPLVADVYYGGKHLYLSTIKKKYKPKSEKEERPLLSRVALHAFALKFKDMDGKIQLIECPYPKDLQVILNQLIKNS